MPSCPPCSTSDQRCRASTRSRVMNIGSAITGHGLSTRALTAQVYGAVPSAPKIFYRPPPRRPHRLPAVREIPPTAIRPPASPVAWQHRAWRSLRLFPASDSRGQFAGSRSAVNRAGRLPPTHGERAINITPRPTRSPRALPARRPIGPATRRARRDFPRW